MELVEGREVIEEIVRARTPAWEAVVTWWQARTCAERSPTSHWVTSGFGSAGGIGWAKPRGSPWTKWCGI